MDWLARREHSHRELIDKLVASGFSTESAEEAVEELSAENLVSDQRFVENLLTARRNRGYGPLRIQHELEQKGVASETIACWLDPLDRSWLQIAVNVKEKKFGNQLPQNLKERARQARFLQYRGFTFDQIKYALDTDHME